MVKHLWKFFICEIKNLQCAKARYGTDKKAQEDGETTAITNTERTHKHIEPQLPFIYLLSNQAI